MAVVLAVVAGVGVAPATGPTPSPEPPPAPPNVVETPRDLDATPVPRDRLTASAAACAGLPAVPVRDGKPVIVQLKPAKAFDVAKLNATSWSRPPVSDPDHSGEVMTGTGAAWVSAKVIFFSSEPSARSCSCLPTRFSRVLKPCTASSPLVVPDSARMASAMRASVSIAGRPSAAPESKTPCLRPSASTSWLTSKVMFLVVSPSLSASGPRATNFWPIAV